VNGLTQNGARGALEWPQRKRRGGVALMCAWAVMLAVGCASTQVEHRNLSLHRRALAENGLAILAVTALGGGDYAAAEAVAAGFQKELARLRPAVRVLSLDTVRKTLDANVYEALLKRADEDRSWTPEHLASFDALTDRVGFGMTIEIREADERHWQHEHRAISDWLFDLILGMLDRNYQPSDSDAEYITVKGASRRVGILFAIYDLRSKEPIWGAFARAKLRATVSLPSASVEVKDANAAAPSPVEGFGRIAVSVIKRLP